MSQPGEVVIEIADGSVARYVVGEQLAGISVPNDAIGETSDVNGTIVFNADGTLQPGRSFISADLRTLQSDEERRDNYIRQNSLESNAYPTAVFLVQEVKGLTWPLPQDGEVSFQLVGSMSLHGVTSPLTWDVTAQFGPDEVTGQSRTVFTFDQFDIDKPSVFLVLSVEDEIRLELDFTASITS
jgi:polyisoprenoid-binding protein YceI